MKHLSCSSRPEANMLLKKKKKMLFSNSPNCTYYARLSTYILCSKLCSKLLDENIVKDESSCGESLKFIIVLHHKR